MECCFVQHKETKKPDIRLMVFPLISPFSPLPYEKGSTESNIMVNEVGVTWPLFGEMMKNLFSLKSASAEASN